MGWAGATREREERRRERSSCGGGLCAASSRRATAAATPRRTARRRSGRSNMWEALAWRMYLCWRQAGCTKRPRGRGEDIGGEGGSGESPRKHVNKAPRLASPPFSSFPLSTASIHTRIPPLLHSHARHPPRTRPRAAHARSRTPRRPRPPCARRQPRRRSPPRRPVRPESQEEAPRRRSQPHHRRGRQVQEETHAVPTARAKGTGKHRSQRLGARKRTGHGYL